QRTLDTALADADPVPAGGGADCRAALRHPHRLSNCPPEQQRSSPGIPSHVTGQRIYDGDNLRVFAIIHRLEAHAARADCPDYHLAHSRGTTCGDPELSALVATCTLTDARNRHHCGYTRSGWLPAECVQGGGGRNRHAAFQFGGCDAWHRHWPRFGD